MLIGSPYSCKNTVQGTLQGTVPLARFAGGSRLVKRVVVIGAGPAGMMAASMAAIHGARVFLVEKANRVGKKLSITGKGRCNMTASVDSDDLIKGFPGNGRFLYSAFSEFSNLDLLAFFHERGLETKVERGNRVFPVSDKASDVVKVLYENAKGLGVEILTSNTVQRIKFAEGKVSGLICDKGNLAADAIIITTGGLSYPATGSTGDGYRWASQAGHRIIDPRPGLVPLLAAETWIKDLQGLSLKNVKASSFTQQGKAINHDFGELLFTHYGLSGPIILSMSHDIGEYLIKKQQPVILKLDLKPALSPEKLDERLQRDLAKYSRKIFKNALNDLLPQKMIPVMIRLSSIDPEKECHQVTRTERLSLVGLLKELTMTVHGTRPIAEAIVTAGGVDVKEVNPKTMESRLVKGLYFAGEVLDVDGYTGGYNLQAAFSTGYVAGKYAAQD
ncbi:MAG TPA: NAD(P)/FAD-dependent oxidoreductase [Syntrophomonadaceae bacterium]|nr:NAD(P)/FAD-dependent oxidoreductase [Syntrophomonadaceae bacterium]